MRKLVTIIGMGVMLACANVAQAKTHYSLFNCDHVLTVQTNGCTVEKYFKCPMQTAYSNGLAVFTGEGIVWQGLMNSEGIPVYENDFYNRMKLRLVPELSDDISDASWRTGKAYKFNYAYGSAEDRPIMRLDTGEGKLTSEQVTIDGVQLTKGLYRTKQEYSFDDTATKITYSAEGEYHFSKELNMFFRGVFTASYSGTDEHGEPYPIHNQDETPVDFIYSDEADFKSQAPKYGCQ